MYGNLVTYLRVFKYGIFAMCMSFRVEYFYLPLICIYVKIMCRIQWWLEPLSAPAVHTIKPSYNENKWELEVCYGWLVPQ